MHQPTLLYSILGNLRNRPPHWPLLVSGLIGLTILPGCEATTLTANSKRVAAVDAETKPKPAAAEDKVEPAVKEPAAAPANAATKDTDKNAGLKALNPQGTVLLDVKGKRVVLKAQVALREGPLELLCCKKQTKEHESVFSVDTQAFVVQTALLALGAKSGGPARIEPVYQPASGEKIDIFVSWTDDKGKPQRQRAREWVRFLTHKFFTVKFPRLPKGVEFADGSKMRFDSITQELSWYGIMSAEEKETALALSKDAEFRKAVQKLFDDSQARVMTADFVFVGSGFQKRSDGTQVFLAEDGDLICVSNFSNSVIDINAKSSSSNESLLFESYTERIPPKGTSVTLELIPVFEEKPEKK